MRKVLEETSIEEAASEKLIDGPALNSQVLQVSPAKEAARRLEKLIHDQIEESNGASEIRNALFESALFGTGIVKGPFNFNKTLSRWEEDEEGAEDIATGLGLDGGPTSNESKIEEAI